MLNSNYLRLAELFPFVDNFLIDARRVWTSNSNHVLDSGVWTEKGINDEEYQLILKAFTVDNQPMLLIENISQQFPEK